MISLDQVVNSPERLDGKQSGYVVTNGINNEFKVQHLRTYEVEQSNVLPNTKTALSLLMNECYDHVHSYTMKLKQIKNEIFLVLTDPRNGDKEVERFCTTRIIYPRYRTCPASETAVNNLLTFVIRAKSLGNGRPKRNEVHFFQVLNCPALVIVKELLKAGALDDDKNSKLNLPARMASEPDLVESTQAVSLNDAPSITSKGEMSVNSKTQQQCKREWIKREVELLNNCFDDMEKYLNNMEIKPKRYFANSTSSVATSSRTKSSTLNIMKNAPSSSLPTSTELTEKASTKDFFQKFKLATILLSRIDGYVTDTNLTDLFRQLFGLLQRAVDATRNTKTKQSDVARETIHPRFPLQTLTFVQPKLSRIQEKFWRDLGPAWNSPREDFPEDTFVYIPRFDNGVAVNRHYYEPSLFKYNEMNKTKSQYVDDTPNNFEVSRPSLYVPRQPKSAEQTVRAMKRYVAQNEQELTVEENEIVELLQVSGNWYKVRNKLNEEGFCPKQNFIKVART